jgi:hypothetical protein
MLQAVIELLYSLPCRRIAGDCDILRLVLLDARYVRPWVTEEHHARSRCGGC